jgi:hypothetical protein
MLEDAMTIQDQYLSTVRKTQETWAGLFETVTHNLQKSFGEPVQPFPYTDPIEAIDQVFDFWLKAVAAQREVAKVLVSANLEVVNDLAREQREAAENAAHKHVAEGDRKA